MPTVTYLGDDSNQATATWMNSITGEKIAFPIREAVDVNPDAPENAKRKDLCRHIIDKLTKVNNPSFRLDNDEPKLPKIDGRSKQARAMKAAQDGTDDPNA